MPEIRNTFIKSKMNKDLDARLLPSGEYRDASNVAVSKSEGEDVGALENILGNVSITDFGLTNTHLEVIGHYENISDNSIIVFLSNYTDTSVNKLSNFALGGTTDTSLGITFSGAECYICYYNAVTGVSKVLVSGSFLNFSKTQPILGVDMIESLLFWTDNRNQPRKINVQKALDDSSYYTTEDQISVAKYYPWEPITFLDGGNSTLKNQSDEFLPYHTVSTINSIGAGPSFVITLSATNSNIAVGDKAFSPDVPEGGSEGTYGIVSNISAMPQIEIQTTGGIALNPVNLGWAASDVIYFARPNPDYNAVFSGDSRFLEDKFPKFSYRFKFDDGENSLMAPFSQAAFIPNQGGCFLFSGRTIESLSDEDKTKTSGVVDFMKNWVDTVGLNIPLPTARAALYDSYKIEEIEILYKDSSSQGVYVVDSIKTGPDTTFNTGNVASASITTAGTGYTNGSYLTDPTNFGNVAANGGTGTGLSFDLIIAGGAVTTAVINSYGSGYTNGDVVTINKSTAGTTAILTLVVSSSSDYLYWYESQKPYQVLPERELIRVHDKVPVRAVAQATSGNRIIYGNYRNKHTSPAFLDYEIKIGTKSTLLTNDIRKELPNHTVKQNRTYQVGVVLVDRFGRASNVILRDNLSVVSSSYSESTLLAGYSNGGTTPYNWPGNSLKINFLSQIPATSDKEGYPGLYSNINPLGWYSYKIVVKQQQQEYYNVYLPGSVSGNINWPGGKNVLLQYSNTSNVANIALFGENINKIPKELQNVGPTDEIFGSNVLLYNRVMNPGEFPAGTANTKNVQSAAYTTAHEVTAIQQFRDLGAWTLEKVNGEICYPSTGAVDPFFNADDNPYIASLSTNFLVGYTSTDQESANFNFSKELIVYETEPVESNLDIYWETTTAGLISTLNSDILTGAGSIPYQLSEFSISFDESLAPQTDIVNTAFEALDSTGNQMADQTSTMVLNRIEDGNGNTVQTGDSGIFELYEHTAAAASTSPTWKIRTGTGKYFTFINGSDVDNNYTFYVTATGNGGSNSFSFNCALSNKVPIITTALTEGGSPIVSGGTMFVKRANAFNTFCIKFTDFINGTNASNTAGKILESTFVIDSVTDSFGNDVTLNNYFEMQNNRWPTITTGGSGPILKTTSANVNGTFVVNIKLTDCWQIFGTTAGAYSSPPALQADFSATIEVI